MLGIRRLVLGHLEGSYTAIDLTEEQVWEVLSGQAGRRRWLIEHIADRDGPFRLRELAEALAYFESDEVDHPDELTAADRKRCYISLYQTHLPRLEEHGVVDWDSDRDTVQVTETGRVLAEAIRSVRRTIGGRS